MSAGIPTDDLAARLETVIRDVPGVSGLYAAAPAIAQALGELPTTATTRPALVRVEGNADPVAVTTVIGVDPGADARVTVRVGRVAV